MGRDRIDHNKSDPCPFHPKKKKKDIQQRSWGRGHRIVGLMRDDRSRGGVGSGTSNFHGLTKINVLPQQIIQLMDSINPHKDRPTKTQREYWIWMVGRVFYSANTGINWLCIENSRKQKVQSNWNYLFLFFANKESVWNV